MPYGHFRVAMVRRYLSVLTLSGLRDERLSAGQELEKPGGFRLLSEG
jgi:hypothetical protein